MPWYFPWSDSIKKRACRYLLHHYLGHFLQEKLTLEQLTVDLYNGTGRVENVPLDVWVCISLIPNNLICPQAIELQIFLSFCSTNMHYYIGVKISSCWCCVIL